MPRRNSLPEGFSGLSALIQAATSQLGHLVEEGAAEEEETGGGGGSESVVAEMRERATRRHSWQHSPQHRTTQLHRGTSRGEATQQLRLKDLRGSKPTEVPSSPSHGRQHNDNAASTAARTTRHARFEDDSQPVTPSIVLEPDPNKQSFPELLMALALNPKNVDVVTFLPDGKFFAMRSREFAETAMSKYFAVSTFQEFLELATDWGFSRILSHQETLAPRDIEVFRHPLFVRANWGLCSQIQFGETPAHARVSALPEMSRIVSGDDNPSPQTPTSTAAAAAVAATTPNDCASGTNTKRRLSPGFLHRRESESSVSSQKLRMRSPGGSNGASDVDDPDGTGVRRESVDSESELERLPSPTTAKTDELRSIALSITTEKLKLKSDSSVLDDPSNYAAATAAAAEDPNRQGKGKLVDRAVESATHTIVTDAIETLLRDETHTKKTYLKHERELSVSSIPGVVPISKQLFSPDADMASSTGLAAQRSVSCDETGTVHNGNAAAASSSGLRSSLDPAEITPPLQPKSSQQNGVPETPLDGPTSTNPASATPPRG
jgi:HSF-type DNA-binding